MSIQYASKVQVETLRDNLVKTEKYIQQFQQGSLRGSRADADIVTAVDTLLGTLNTALDAVIAAAVDNTPSAFTFTDVTGAALNTVYVSNAITLAGLSDNVPVAITVTGGTYSINGGAYTSAAGTAKLGDVIRARAVSSGSTATAVNVAVTIGGVSDTYTVTTA